MFDLYILTAFPNKIEYLSSRKYPKIEWVEWLKYKEKEKKPWGNKTDPSARVNEYFLEKM